MVSLARFRTLPKARAEQACLLCRTIVTSWNIKKCRYGMKRRYYLIINVLPVLMTDLGLITCVGKPALVIDKKVQEENRIPIIEY